mmetsp:Transcript_29810/g.79610  ORF Transcript_29810/g.79610 Transcript_29810/m.79610 type:complete len:374 (+) Transcript_29810:221-1342(+)
MVPTVGNVHDVARSGRAGDGPLPLRQFWEHLCQPLADGLPAHDAWRRDRWRQEPPPFFSVNNLGEAGAVLVPGRARCVPRDAERRTSTDLTAVEPYHHLGRRILVHQRIPLLRLAVDDVSQEVELALVDPGCHRRVLQRVLRRARVHDGRDEVAQAHLLAHVLVGDPSDEQHVRPSPQQRRSLARTRESSGGALVIRPAAAEDHGPLAREPLLKLAERELWAHVDAASAAIGVAVGGTDPRSGLVSAFAAGLRGHRIRRAPGRHRLKVRDHVPVGLRGRHRKVEGHVIVLHGDARRLRALVEQGVAPAVRQVQQVAGALHAGATVGGLLRKLLLELPARHAAEEGVAGGEQPPVFSARGEAVEGRLVVMRVSP